VRDTDNVDSRPPGFWERWWVRLMAAVVISAAVIGGAVAGDPSRESWEAKTWGLLHTIAATSVGRR